MTMNYPQYQQPAQQVPGGFVQPGQQQGYPQPPAQQYAPPAAPQGYQPQYAPPAAPQGYYQQPPVQQYAPPAAPQEPAAQGSLDKFYSQTATGGGNALKFENVGETVDALIARDVTDADVQHQTEMNSDKLKYYRDGSPMFVLVLPLILPNGDPATHWIKGPNREALISAMTAAGCPPKSYPKGGDRIRITLSAKTKVRGFNTARNDFAYQYTRANQPGGGPNTAQQFSPAAQPAPAPVQQFPAPQMVSYGRQTEQGPVQPHPQFVQAAPVQQPGWPAGVGGQTVVAQPEQAQATPGAQFVPGAPAGMSSEQAAAFQNLLGAMGQPQQ